MNNRNFECEFDSGKDAFYAHEYTLFILRYSYKCNKYHLSYMIGTKDYDITINFISLENANQWLETELDEFLKNNP